MIEALNKTSERAFTQVDHDLLRVVAQLAATALIRAETVTGEGPGVKR